MARWDKGRRGYRAGEQQPDKPEGGWLVCGHPFRGVDIVGPKISLNSGGSPGTPVPALQPAVLKTLGMRRVVMAVIPEKKNEDSGGNCVTGSGGDDRGDDEDEPENILSSSILQTMTGYRIQKPATLPSLRMAQTHGETDEEGIQSVFFLYLANMKLK